MNWNGVIGTVASVINTALPLFFGAAKDGENLAGPTAIGPATLYESGNTLKIGNYLGGPDKPKVLLNFASPAGDTHSNLAIEIPYGEAFIADPWLQKYTDGSVTVGVTEPGTSSGAGGLEAFFTFVSNTVLGAKDTITAIINPSLSLNLNTRFDVGNQVVAVAAIGAVALLGREYMITARNNAGKVGSRAGTIDLQPPPQDGQVGDGTFTISLPTGIDYSDGIYDLQLQVAIQLSPEAVASDPEVAFVTISDEDRARITAAQRIAA